MTTDTDRAIGLLDDADERLEDANTLVSALTELVQRINAGKIDLAARADLGGDIVAAAERLHAYGLTVIG